jgi:hypothetical protein
MGRKRAIGTRVRIECYGGMREFWGQTGTIIGYENYGGGIGSSLDGPFYRVKLDSPVEVDGVGMVEDDLWIGALLKTIPSEAQKARQRDNARSLREVYSSLGLKKGKYGGWE